MIRRLARVERPRGVVVGVVGGVVGGFVGGVVGGSVGWVMGHGYSVILTAN